MLPSHARLMILTLRSHVPGITRACVVCKLCQAIGPIALAIASLDFYTETHFRTRVGCQIADRGHLSPEKQGRFIDEVRRDPHINCPYLVIPLAQLQLLMDFPPV